MAAIDYSKYGASPEVDYSKYGAVSEQALPQQGGAERPLYQRIVPDIATGLATAGQGLHNFLFPFAKTNIDFGREVFGVNNPRLSDTLIQGGAQYAPYAAGESAVLAGKGLGALGKLGADALTGGIFGGTQSEHPVQGAIIGSAAGAGGGLAGRALGSLAGIPSAIKNYLGNSALVKNATNFLNDLGSGVSDRANAPLSLKDNVAGVYKGNQQTATQLAEPLNNSKAKFYVDDPKAGFNNYINASKELLENRDTLRDLFGSDTSLGAKLNKELDIADTFAGTIKKGKPSIILNESGEPAFYKYKTVDFQDIWQRLKDLGQMQAKASAAGGRNEARIIGNLRAGLSDDLQTNLQNSGNGDLAQQLLTFNNFYKNKVAPFWGNTTISKAAQMPRYVPDGASLAKALHAPSLDNRLVFDQLAPEMKNAAAYQLITGGKGTAEGLSKMTAEDIGKAYGRLNSNVKATIASHNPAANTYFENLYNLFSKKQSSGLSGLLNNAADKFFGVPVSNSLSYLPKSPISPNIQNALGFGLTPALSNMMEGYANGGR